MSTLLALLMAAQAFLGLTVRDQYRDVEWIKMAWFGNDWVTLVVAVPLLLASHAAAGRGSVRGRLLWLGLLGYAIYNYAFYLFGAALNVYLPLYVAAIVLATLALIGALARLDVASMAGGFDAATPVRTLGGTLVIVGGGLAVVWVALWAAHVFAGRPTPVEPEAFKVVAALDLTLMVPALAGGGVLLWRRRPWGFVLAAIASIQGALYLLVLSVNSVVAMRRGLVEAAGELPVWGALMVVTAAVAATLLAHAGRVPARTR